jgi:hypothetical protein
VGYYEDLYNVSEDATLRAAWRHRSEQALRFEAALDAMPALGAGARVLDVGCGPGALLGYMRDAGRAPSAYLGLDQLGAAVAHARLREPQGRFELARWPAWQPAAGEQWEEIVGIGCVVDGEQRRGAARAAHIAAQLDHMCALATRGACLIVLSEEARVGRASLALEPALAGLTQPEARALVARLCARHGMWGWIREDVLPTDRALYLRRSRDLHITGDHTTLWSCDLHGVEDNTARDMSDLQRGEDRAEARWALARRALAGPWGAAMGPEEQAWLWLEVGCVEEAARALGARRAGEGGRRALLWERISAAGGGGG